MLINKVRVNFYEKTPVSPHRICKYFSLAVPPTDRKIEKTGAKFTRPDNVWNVQLKIDCSAALLHEKCFFYSFKLIEQQKRTAFIKPKVKRPNCLNGKHQQRTLLALTSTLSLYSLNRLSANKWAMGIADLWAEIDRDFCCDVNPFDTKHIHLTMRLQPTKFASLHYIAYKPQWNCSENRNEIVQVNIHDTSDNWCSQSIANNSADVIARLYFFPAFSWFWIAFYQRLYQQSAYFCSQYGRI